MSSVQRLLTTLMLLILLPSSLATVHAQEAAELQITSERYIVVDAATGHVFAQRGANDRVPIASLTKVFTAVQAMEMAPLDTPVITKDSDLRSPEGTYFGTSGTLMGFGTDEPYTLEDMLYGMLLPSGNDAANAIARTLGARPGESDAEAVQHFMDLLNQRIADMGLEDTFLKNPHGWGVEGHYSSASDVAAFNRFITHYPALMGIMGADSYTTSNGFLTVNNTNRSLNQYPSVEAGKTGFDLDAGYCLINIARRDETEMIAVTLDGVAPGDWYDDNATLLDYGFDQQAELLTSGVAFQGDVATFVDPSTASIARSARPSTAFVPGQTVAEAEGRPPEPVVVAREPEPPTISEGSLWIAAVAAIGLLGYRGLLSFRGPSRHRHTKPPASSVSSAID
ncbi:MAG: serine hydrolase [Chloroflexota bacterium]|nr:serine hydrolase [Chloroflexota bacterium]